MFILSAIRKSINLKSSPKIINPNNIIRKYINLCDYHKYSGTLKSFCPIIHSSIEEYPNVVRTFNEVYNFEPPWYFACGSNQICNKVKIFIPYIVPTTIVTTNIDNTIDNNNIINDSITNNNNNNNNTISVSAILKYAYDENALYTFPYQLLHISRQIDNITISYNAQWLQEFVIGIHEINFTALSKQLYSYTLALTLRKKILNISIIELKKSPSNSLCFIDTILPILLYFLKDIKITKNNDNLLISRIIELLAEPLIRTVREMFTLQDIVKNQLNNLNNSTLIESGNYLYYICK